MNIDVYQFLDQMQNSRDLFWTKTSLLGAYGISDQSAIATALAFIIGACLGSCINVVSHRSLNRESWWWPASHCPKCKGGIAPYDLIPVLSYFILKGRCRMCQASISFHYPLVELSTGVLIALVLHKFGWTPDGAAMTIFTCTLMAVTVTDFKEKLIPHEITYPAILLGLTYYALRWGNVGDALIGAGASYILFDFIDFYGLIAISHLKDDDEMEEEATGEDALIDRTFDIKEEVYDPDDDIVMGGGDAVLSALIACWLGWKCMVMAVVIAFLIGSLMGAVYLFIDMHKRGILENSLKPACLGFIIGFTILSLPLFVLHSTQVDQSWNWQYLILPTLAGLAGALFGALWGGPRFQNRFPFGPALAFGAIFTILVLFDCDWLRSMGITNQGYGIDNIQQQLHDRQP